MVSSALWRWLCVREEYNHTAAGGHRAFSLNSRPVGDQGCVHITTARFEKCLVKCNLVILHVHHLMSTLSFLSVISGSNREEDVRWRMRNFERTVWVLTTTTENRGFQSQRQKEHLLTHKWFGATVLFHYFILLHCLWEGNIVIFHDVYLTSKF